jgi:2-oxo-4-hydroxy-4-carboxy-5-ureidoimidazoline decarboxylase
VTTLDGLNVADRASFVAVLGGIFEHAPWVAERAFAVRPFALVSEIHNAMLEAVAAASEAEQLALIRGHPELGGKVARAGAMTAESRGEQGSLGLDNLSDQEFARFERLNAAYRQRFGFPFVICARRHTRDSIIDNFERRLANGPEAERAAALAEIAHIARLRLADAVDGPGKPKTDGRLSTHVLDTASGRPAAGVKVVLKEIGASAEGLLKEAITNADGRTDEPLLAGAPLRIGRYQLEFHIGAYFAAHGMPASSPPFLDVVPIRFAVAEPEGHYHVPLLSSPWSYSTYRGS